MKIDNYFIYLVLLFSLPSAYGMQQNCTTQSAAQAEVDINIVDECGRTALHQAVSDNHITAVQHLMSKGAHTNVQDKSGATALHLAVARPSDIAIVHSLISKGANIHIQNDKGLTPFAFVASYYEPGEIRRTLLEKYNRLEQEVRSKPTTTTLDKVVKHNFVYLAKLLLQQGIIPTEHHLNIAKLYDSKVVGCLIAEYLRLSSLHFGAATDPETAYTV
jgi:Ankyrin repeats (3 copies)